MDGKVILVTGSSQGVGLAIAKVLLQKNTRLILTSRNMQKLTEVKAKLSRLKNDINVFSCDATIESEVTNLIQKIEKKFGKIDILINNVGGVKSYGGFFDLNNNDWIDSFNLNVITTVNFVKHSYKLLLKSKCASIVNIASITGIEPGQYNPHYSITKAAIINLTKHLANLFAKNNIRVNVICPGIINSESRNNFLNYFSKKEKIHIDEVTNNANHFDMNNIPLGKLGEGEDVANIVSFLASEKSSWITGSCFNIDGGKAKSIF
ncbi:MAG: hypothetical protein A3F40_03835 [Chlamydiae bacterium RIFCSPHIGHO2_12_FULL_27_8]|nr:MAG: hypothetical protein A3F40_03835 [Chlamydiae bacterium RIFCSPHIGHO2_12_FULL_27_8]